MSQEGEVGGQEESRLEKRGGDKHDVTLSKERDRANDREVERGWACVLRVRGYDII